MQPACVQEDKPETPEASECSTAEASWDEEEFGDRTYYDATFEINSEFLPWNMKGDAADERWGL